MKNLISNATRMGFSGLGNVLLTTCVTGVTVTAIGLMALYLIKHIDSDTPELVQLQCAVGVARADCPKYGAEMEALKGKLSDLAEKTAKAQSKLSNLGRIEENVDSVTLFDTTDIPGSDLSVTVGTRYSRLLEPELEPSYFCYISLQDTDGVDRSLYIRNADGDIDPSAATMRQNGVSDTALAFARSVCKPFLIGGSA